VLWRDLVAGTIPLIEDPIFDGATNLMVDGEDGFHLKNLESSNPKEKTNGLRFKV
jgi:hypothetical protein